MINYAEWIARSGVAGGARKFNAILGAIRGGWVNVLVTDLLTARRLTAAEG
ncbi:MAG: hypothetical protein IPK16_22820 [Anaerolineales bacterium]|nr:hypothetical protein [Anaerolineales bacterium]